jgi:toxin ParE1/3/4
VERVLDRFGQLALFPMAGGTPRELSGTRYRQLIVPPVRIFYRAEGKRVLVVHVMRGERLMRRTDF